MNVPLQQIKMSEVFLQYFLLFEMIAVLNKGLF